MQYQWSIEKYKKTNVFFWHSVVDPQTASSKIVATTTGKIVTVITEQNPNKPLDVGCQARAEDLINC